MTDNNPSKPDDMAWITASCMILGIIGVFTHGVPAMVSGALWLYIGGSAVWTIGRWFWASSRHHRD